MIHNKPHKTCLRCKYQIKQTRKHFTTDKIIVLTKKGLMFQKPKVNSLCKIALYELYAYNSYIINRIICFNLSRNLMLYQHLINLRNLILKKSKNMHKISSRNSMLSIHIKIYLWLSVCHHYL